jgi:hypothetical protein
MLYHRNVANAANAGRVTNAHSLRGLAPDARGYGELAKLSSFWLQFIWLTVGSTVETRDLVKLSNNSIPTAPTINRVDSVALALSSADSGPQKAGVLVQSWSKASTKQRKRPTPCESAFLFTESLQFDAELYFLWRSRSRLGINVPSGAEARKRNPKW